MLNEIIKRIEEKDLTELYKCPSCKGIGIVGYLETKEYDIGNLEIKTRDCFKCYLDEKMDEINKKFYENGHNTRPR